METKNLFKWMFMMVIPFFLASGIQAQTAAEIIKKMEDKFQGSTAEMEMTITIQRPTWSREMAMKSWSKGDDYSLVMITSPVKDKGTVFLKRGKEVWNWVPAIERTIKLPPSMMSQSWMGTDFTNDDLVQQSSMIKDFTSTIEKDTVVEGRQCWKIKMIPKEDAAVVWGKINLFVDKQEHMQMRTEFYDEDEYIVNIMQGYDVKNIGGKILPTRMEMIPVEKPGNKTIMEYKSMTWDKPISDSFFTTQNMQKVR